MPPNIKEAHKENNNILEDHNMDLFSPIKPAIVLDRIEEKALNKKEIEYIPEISNNEKPLSLRTA
ncbi:hypothetical protein NCMFCNCE_02744 [Mannheimia haemolytica]|nr:hypothetical protein [Mannheimia haemolytica]EDN73598.1 hypothetical protein MHA_0634 [Mannheimia haemolytica PHL213]KYL13530.1 hypothetical protein AC570_12020 [Mannheimia haemolytica]KYL16034.1 hypothetical protein AC572_11380 [Mannheimia haemolytica]HDL4658051.1 hypothetical protein [Mannheimia haemolytica]HDL5518231.1 hypothetical protein [Mannheimia haemolytica]